MGALPYHLRFLEGLRQGGSGSLEDYYPETAAELLEMQPNAELFPAGGLTYVAAGDGRLVPVDIEGLEPMQDNIWDGNKLAALVDAAEAGDEPHVTPGYADLWMRDGVLHAQVRDGNHRTFASVVAGSDFSWVWISERTRQDLDERKPGTEKLYRAIRAAQREHGAPQFKRKKWGKLKKGAKAKLLKAERRYVELDEAIDEYRRNLLRRHGFAESGFSPDEQLERPHLFWRMRAKELRDERGLGWYVDNIIQAPEAEADKKVRSERDQLRDKLYDLRRASGLQHGESLDPRTGEILRNPSPAKLAFADSPSPLDYGGPERQRLALVDPAAGAPPPNDAYFAGSKKLPGAGAGVVGFLDYLPWGDAIYIDYITVRADQRGRGHTRRLVDEFYRRHAQADMISFGEIHADAVAKLYREKRALHDQGKAPYTKGKLRNPTVDVVGQMELVRVAGATPERTAHPQVRIRYHAWSLGGPRIDEGWSEMLTVEQFNERIKTIVSPDYPVAVSVHGFLLGERDPRFQSRSHAWGRPKWGAVQKAAPGFYIGPQTRAPILTLEALVRREREVLVDRLEEGRGDRASLLRTLANLNALGVAPEGGSGDYSQVPPGYVFAQAGSHRAREKVSRVLGRDNVIWLTSFRAKGPAGRSRFFVTPEQFEQIRHITGVSLGRFRPEDRWMKPMSFR